MSILIREARVSDAAALMAHVQQVLSEPVMIPKLPEEAVMTLEQEETFLADLAIRPNAHFWVACEGEKIIGNLDILGLKRSALAHVGVLGISIQRAYRGQGLGKRLIQHGLEWARTSPLKRIELYVYADNAPAIALYEQFGFVHEGRRRGVIRDGDRYLDDLVMGLWLED